MNHKRLISLTTCFILFGVLGSNVQTYAANESSADVEVEQHFEKANGLYDAADYNGAIAEYEKITNLSPNGRIAQNARYWIGQSHFAAGEYDSALVAFQGLVADYPTSAIIPSTQLMIGRVEQSKEAKALFEAVEKGDIERVKALMAAGADVNLNIGGEDVWMPLHQAAWYGHTDIMELLIAEGADVNVRSRNRWTPLHCAANEGHLDAAELLISKGAQMEALNRGLQTPLIHAACWAKDQDMVKLLLKRGAYVDGRGYQDVTPLYRAITEGQQDMVELLLAHGAAPWRRRFGVNLVGTAMKANKKEIVRFLVDKGIEHSEVHVAALFGDTDEVKSYLAAGGDINAKDPSQLTLLACAMYGGHTAEMEFLISKGADIDLKDAEGMTALHRAAEGGHSEIVRMLLEKGADIRARDQYGATPLFRAVLNRKSNVELIEMMLSKGADVNARTGLLDYPIADEAYTALHLACRTGKKAIAEVLIAHGADVNAKTKRGKTPMSAVKDGYWDPEQVIELLRKHGAKE